jgi:hypothetical protein
MLRPNAQHIERSNGRTIQRRMQPTGRSRSRNTVLEKLQKNRVKITHSGLRARRLRLSSGVRCVVFAGINRAAL